MPTYLCRLTKGILDRSDKRRLAQAITTLHTNATGAQGFFAQVLFADVDEDDAFLGGKPATAPICFIHGHIRAGRSAGDRDRLIRSIAEAAAEIARVPPEAVWVYLAELPAPAMIEYGRVLPEPGDEDVWLAALPEPLRRRLVD